MYLFITCTRETWRDLSQGECLLQIIAQRIFEHINSFISKTIKMFYDRVKGSVQTVNYIEMHCSNIRYCIKNTKCKRNDAPFVTVLHPIHDIHCTVESRGDTKYIVHGTIQRLITWLITTVLYCRPSLGMFAVLQKFPLSLQIFPFF